MKKFTKVWECVPAITTEWFRWRGRDAGLDGSERGAAYIRLYQKYGAISLSSVGRPYYFPTEDFLPFRIVDACGDRLYRLPLTAQARNDIAEITAKTFFEELDALEQEVRGWDARVRSGTKTRRLDVLFDVRKRLGLYDSILGSMTATIGDRIYEIEEQIRDVLLGSSERID